MIEDYDIIKGWVEKALERAGADIEPALLNAATYEVVNNLLFDCNRSTLPARAYPIIADLVIMKAQLDAQYNSATIDSEDGGADAGGHEAVASVALQSTRVEYLTRANDPYSKEAQRAAAYEKLKADYNDRYKSVVYSLRQLPQDWKNKYKRA